MRRLSLCMALAAVLPLNSCVNIYGGIDNPSGDAQFLSAARACFDQGDIACAREMYGKLGTNEVAIAESAFLTLDELGLGIGPLAIAISRGSSSPGAIVTNLVEAAAMNANATTRDSLVESYKSIVNIRSTELRGFVRFVTAMSIMADLLAEQGGVQADRIFNKGDLVLTPAACSAVALGAGCLAEAGCGRATSPGAGGLAATSGTEPTVANFVTNPATASMAGTPSLQKVYIALLAASQGLTEMDIQDSGSSSLKLIQQLTDNPAYSPTFGANTDRCFRFLLISTNSSAVGAGR